MLKCNNMKILLLGGDEKVLESGGASQQRMASYGSLAEQIHILIFSGKQLPLQQIGNVFIYSSTGNWRLAHFFKACFLAKKIIIRNHIDVISTQDPFESALIGWWQKKTRRVKLNVQVHGDFFSEDYWKKQRWFNFVRYHEAAFVLKKADSVRVVSERIKKSLVNKFKVPAKKIIVAPIYSDFSGFNKEPPQQKSGQFVFLTVSRFTKEKNLPMALRAFARLRKNDKEAVLRIAGEGPERKNLENLAKKLRVQERVQFLGWLDKEKLAAQYGGADCFLLPSDFEGWGLAALEVAFFGLAIVMTNVGICGEILRPGSDVLSVAPRDEGGFTAAMQRVLDDEALRANLGRNAKLALSGLPTRGQTMELYKKAWFIV